MKCCVQYWGAGGQQFSHLVPKIQTFHKKNSCHYYNFSILEKLSFLLIIFIKSNFY